MFQFVRPRPYNKMRTVHHCHLSGRRIEKAYSRTGGKLCTKITHLISINALLDRGFEDAAAYLVAEPNPIVDLGYGA